MKVKFEVEREEMSAGKVNIKFEFNWTYSTSFTFFASLRFSGANWFRVHFIVSWMMVTRDILVNLILIEKHGLI